MCLFYDWHIKYTQGKYGGGVKELNAFNPDPKSAWPLSNLCHLNYHQSDLCPLSLFPKPSHSWFLTLAPSLCWNYCYWGAQWYFFKVFFLCGPLLKSFLQSCFYSMFWFFGCMTCGILVHQSGIVPAPAALKGKFLTTGPLGKSSTPHSDSLNFHGPGFSSVPIF